MESNRNCSKTFPESVCDKNFLNLIEILLGRFQIVSQPKFFASPRNFPECVLEKIQFASY